MLLWLISLTCSMWPMRFGRVLRLRKSRVKVHGGGGCAGAAFPDASRPACCAALAPSAASARTTEEVCRLLRCAMDANSQAEVGLRLLAHAVGVPAASRHAVRLWHAAMTGALSRLPVQLPSARWGTPVAADETHRCGAAAAGAKLLWPADVACDSTLIRARGAAPCMSPESRLLAIERRTACCSTLRMLAAVVMHRLAANSRRWRDRHMPLSAAGWLQMD